MTGKRIRRHLTIEEERMCNMNIDADLLREINEMRDLFPNDRFWKPLKRWMRSPPFFSYKRKAAEGRISVLDLLDEIAENCDIRIPRIGLKGREFFRKVADCEDFFDC